MSRYLRTENRIYDGSLYLRKYTGWYFHKESKFYTFTDSDIVKTADTIEELCDEWVIKYKSEEKPRRIDMTEFLKALENCNNAVDGFRTHIKWLITNYKDQLEICKLAIWTDKGLIYVAKVNKEGEFELL